MGRIGPKVFSTHRFFLGGSPMFLDETMCCLFRGGGVEVPRLGIKVSRGPWNAGCRVSSIIRDRYINRQIVPGRPEPAQQLPMFSLPNPSSFSSVW